MSFLLLLSYTARLPLLLLTLPPQRLLPDSNPTEGGDGSTLVIASWSTSRGRWMDSGMGWDGMGRDGMGWDGMLERL